MSIDYYNDFSMPPDSGLFTLNKPPSGSNSSFSYNQSSQSVDLVSLKYGALLSLIGLPSVTQSELISFSSDIEFIVDTAGLKIVGIFLAVPGGTLFGYLITHINNAWALYKYADISWNSGVAIPINLFNNKPFNVGMRSIFKIEKQGDLFWFYVDDVLVFFAKDSDMYNLIPCLYVYGSTIKIHDVRYNIQEKTITNKLLTNRCFFSNKENREQAWPGENSYKQLDSQTAEKVYGITTAAMLNAPPLRKDFGFIEGVVTRKTAAAIGQHVICLDDRFNLVAETLSGVGGYYRFDSLPINGLYAIHAYDNNEYKYAPVGADRRTPEAYV